MHKTTDQIIYSYLSYLKELVVYQIKSQKLAFCTSTISFMTKISAILYIIHLRIKLNTLIKATDPSFRVTEMSRSFSLRV